MKKDFVSIFNKDISEDISIDEYELDGLLDKNVEIKENELPTVLIDKEDDTNKYININNSSDLNLLNLNENKNIEDNNEIKTNENEIENNENDFNESYNEENNSYENLENEVGLTESDLIDIEFVDDFNLEDAVFNSKGNDIYKNNSEKLNISDINDIEETDLIEENNLKKEDEIVECEDKEVVVPSLDDVDYIDESDYINSIDSNEEIIELSGNELDLITKDEDISEDEGNILKVSGGNMRKDNFLLEEQTIENESEHIGDINGIDREKEEQAKTDYYINKYKKLHDEYMKSVEEESKSGEENTISVAESNIELESKPEDNTIEESNIELESKTENNIIEESKEELITETIEPLTENTDESDKTNYYINKYKKLHDEYMKSVEEENKLGEENTISVAESNIELDSKLENNIIEESKETINETECIEEILDNLEVTDKLSVEEEEMYRAYLGEDADLIEEVEDIIPEDIAEKVEKTDENEEMQLNVLEVTDKLSVEEEEMYKAYLGEDANLINEVEDNEEIISKESEDNDEVNIDLEIAKNELKKKEETLSKLEIIGELTADEESLVEDILKQNKNKYYEYDINYSDIILKELDLEEIEEINENDFNILENFILGKEPEEGIELISINNEKNNENEPSKNNDNQIKSIDSFDSIDSEELLKVKETKMPEEKELKTDEQNIDLNVKVEDEFSLNKDDSVLTEEKINQRENNKEDFDGEITQMDLDFAIKLFENEDQKENQGEYGPKHDLLLSENDVVKFRKLFSYFKIIVEKLPQESLKDFSKTEFYDAYSSLFRKFGE